MWLLSGLYGWRGKQSVRITGITSSETAMDAYPCDWTLHCRTKIELYNAAGAVLNKECE